MNRLDSIIVGRETEKLGLEGRISICCHVIRSLHTLRYLVIAGYEITFNTSALCEAFSTFLPISFLVHFKIPVL
jgi:hypothetical protein